MGQANKRRRWIFAFTLHWTYDWPCLACKLAEFVIADAFGGVGWLFREGRIVCGVLQ